MIGKFIARFFGQAPKKAEISGDLWQKTLELPFLAALCDEEKERLHALLIQFLSEKEFTAAGGLELDDEICLSIAAQGCLPILNLGLEWYRGWVGIIVYPDEFVIPRTVEDEDGIVHEYTEVASGEAWDGGPLLISWQDAQMAGSGYNVVIHEFAHKIDMLSGAANGMPPLHGNMSRALWRSVFEAAYQDFCRRVDDEEEVDIDPYASEHPSEFFAVISESFFEDPELVAREYPALYEQLAAFYRQDPLARFQKSEAAHA
ncbi:MAG: zinc-dependent peptidase [Betaproteobacteria bacterium]|nr:zinc-dependent peptidase [Betaproteobacteria bacterium]